MTKKLKQRKQRGPHSELAAKDGILVVELDAVPVETAAFFLNEDGTIHAMDGAPVVEQRKSSPPSPPCLAYRDDPRGLWLYHGNSLELLDAIATKYPDEQVRLHLC